MSLIIKEINNHIVWLTINRPEAMNAMNEEVIKELDSALHSCISDDSVGVIIISGSGEKAFIAGADIEEMSDFTVSNASDYSQKGIDLFNNIESYSKPVIAAINGYALGGGLELALACDFRVSAKNALFSFPETSIGIIPGAGGTQRMVKLFGIPLSMKWIFSAEKYNANAAYYDGIIDFIVENQSLDKFSLELANKIIQNAPISLKSAKSAILSAQYNEGFVKERKQYINTLDSKDRDEGLLSFKEKRSPNWKNK